MDFVEAVKLIDFGLSIVLLRGETITEFSGTLSYCSPEIVSRKPHFESTDVWSLGIMLYTLLTRRMPFISLERDQTIENIKNKPLNFE